MTLRFWSTVAVSEFETRTRCYRTLARPQNLLLYGKPLDLFDVAASLAFGIMWSHPFQDGNKRSSWIAIQVTLLSNGIDNKPDSEEARDKMFDLANK